MDAGRLFFGKKATEREQEAGILRFVHRYGLLGFITALPTTPKFMDYEKVYLPKNHFIREEALETHAYLDYFFPFKKLNIYKRGKAFQWEVDGDTDSKALALTFLNEPDAMSMSFQKEYAEPLEWIAKALKDLTFPFITSKYFYEEADASMRTKRGLWRKVLRPSAALHPPTGSHCWTNPPSSGISILC